MWLDSASPLRRHLYITIKLVLSLQSTSKSVFSGAGSAGCPCLGVRLDSYDALIYRAPNTGIPFGRVPVSAVRWEEFGG